MFGWGIAWCAIAGVNKEGWLAGLLAGGVLGTGALLTAAAVEKMVR